MLALSRKLPEGLENVKNGALGGPTGLALYGKTVGIIGKGLIGREVGRMCEHGFRMKTIQVNSKSSRRDLEALLEGSDIVTLHCPLNEGTEGMIGEEEIRLMKQGVLVVNTARGKLVTKAEMAEGLRTGKNWSCRTKSNES